MYMDVIFDFYDAADLADQFSRPISFGTCLDETAGLHDAFEGFDIDGQAADQRVVEKHCSGLGAERTVVEVLARAFLLTRAGACRQPQGRDQSGN